MQKSRAQLEEDAIGRGAENVSNMSRAELEERDITEEGE